MLLEKSCKTKEVSESYKLPYIRPCSAFPWCFSAPGITHIKSWKVKNLQFLKLSDSISGLILSILPWEKEEELKQTWNDACHKLDL